MSDNLPDHSLDNTQMSESADELPLSSKSVRQQLQVIEKLLSEAAPEAAAEELRKLTDRLSVPAARNLREECQVLLDFVTAKIEESGGHIENALILYQRAFDHQPDNGHIASALSRLQMRIGNLDEAIRTLQKGAISTDRLKSQGYLTSEALTYRMRLKPCNRPRFSAPLALEPDLRAVMVMVVRDEDDVIIASLVHHYNLGIRMFFLCNNMSKDGTTELIEYFRVSHPDALVVQIRDDAVGFFQREKTEAMVDFATKYGKSINYTPQWCFVLDADEFIDPPSPEVGVKGLLDQLSGEYCIGFPVHNATAEDGSSFDHFRRSIYDHFDLIERRSVRTRKKVKMAFRLEAGAKLSLGNHRVFIPGLSPDKALAASDLGYRIVHLPTRSVRQILKKAARSNDVFKNEGVHAGRIWVGPSNLVMKEGEEGAKAILAKYSGSLRASIYAAASEEVLDKSELDTEDDAAD